VRKADEVMPLLRKKTQAQDRRIADLEKSLKNAVDHLGKTEQRMYNRALADLQARQEEAVEAGDVDAHRKIGKEIHELDADIKSKDTGPAASELEVQEALIEWRAANKWYSDEGGLCQGLRRRSGRKIQGQDGGNAARGVLRKVLAEETLKRFPDAARQDRAPPPDQPRRGTIGTRRTPRGEVVRESAREAKAACDRMHRMGILKGPQGKELSQAEARTQYCRDFDWS
jgi:hypothetical protein